MPIDPAFLGTIRYRCIGPTRGGRVMAVAGDPDERSVFYFGAVAGGVWRTDDAGTYWECITDGFLTTSSIGAIAVAESDPNVIYAARRRSRASPATPPRRRSSPTPTSSVVSRCCSPSPPSR